MRCRLIIGAVALVCAVCDGRENISVAVMGSYTTSTRFLYNVDHEDVFIDNKYFSFNFGYGLDIRWLAHGDDILVGLNVEKIRTLERTTGLVSDQGIAYSVPVEEGFVVYPVELSGYFIIPVSSEDIRAYLGGGIGWYSGERLYSVANVHMTTVNSPSGFGIHVLTGVDVHVYSKIAVRVELKFRDPQFDSVNRFEDSSTTYRGVTINLDRSSTKTRVNLNGITYGIGLAFLL
jgi:hypothetical protein